MILPEPPDSTSDAVGPSALSIPVDTSPTLPSDAEPSVPLDIPRYLSYVPSLPLAIPARSPSPSFASLAAPDAARGRGRAHGADLR